MLVRLRVEFPLSVRGFPAPVAPALVLGYHAARATILLADLARRVATAWRFQLAKRGRRAPAS